MEKTFPRVRMLLQEEVKRFGSVNQVALKTGLTNNTVGKYLDGISEPQQDTLEKLAIYFKRPVAWLRGDTDDTTMQPAAPNSSFVDLSSLSAEQRKAWDLLTQLPLEKQAKAMRLLEFVLSDDQIS